MLPATVSQAQYTDYMHTEAFVEIAKILGLSTLLSIVGRKLQQPMIIMFLAAGIVAGPAVFGFIESYEEIELLAHIGISLLLFIVGLKLDVKLIKTTGPVAFATGVGQILFTSAIGFGLALLMGMDAISAAYVAVAMTFSSTIIIVKLLSDKREIDSLHGQIAIGFLIVQDIAAILALVLLTSLGEATAEASILSTIGMVVLKSVGLICFIALLMRFVLPWVTRKLAESQELLVLFSIAWAVSLGAGCETLGFSKEVGAFLAGVSLASTSYRESIGSRLTSLRDFLLLFFFIDLGARLDLSMAADQFGDALVLSLFVLVGNPVIVLVIMGLMGYRKRTSFLAGLTVAQISEFSLIVAALGLGLGHIADTTMGLVTLVGVITIFASTYLILYSSKLYSWLSSALSVFERDNPYRELALDQGTTMNRIDMIVMGLDNYGSELADFLVRRGKNIIGVDFDPARLETWHERGVQVRYGDIGDPETLSHLPLESAQWVVCTVSSSDLTEALLHHLQVLKFQGKVAVTAGNAQRASEYEAMGVAAVLRPYADAAEHAADALAYAMELLPDTSSWPVAIREIRIGSDSAVAGKRVAELHLRQETGASILAVSRGGEVNYAVTADQQLFPGDRIVVIGNAEQLWHAEAMFERLQSGGRNVGQGQMFDLAEIRIDESSDKVGQTLAELRFKQEFGVSVVGIRRDEHNIANPGATEKICAGDCLFVIGAKADVDHLRNRYSS